MKTIVFDLNGTLTESKSDIDPEMLSLLVKLLSKQKVCILSGASWKQIEKQIISYLPTKDINILNNLYVLPTAGASLFQYWNKYGWVAIYQNKLDKHESDKISKVLEKYLKQNSLSDRLWGKQVENRESQVTLSCLGQKAPLDDKENWDPDFSKRKAIVSELVKELPNFDLRIAGYNSIDITPKGINKHSGLHQLMKHLHISKDEVVFVGDAIFEGGVDYPVVDIGIEFVKVTSIDETKKFLTQLLVVADKAA